jgi:TonB family protein
MATTEIPPTRKNADLIEGPDGSLHDVPVLLVQMQDELARARKREAFWISVIFHIVAIFAIAIAPKYFPDRKAILVATPEQMIADRQLTYLDLPKDNQKLDRRPNTNVISDKDRIATRHGPELNRSELQKILDSGRPGPPGAPGRPGPMVPPSPPPQMVQGQQQQQNNQNGNGLSAPNSSQNQMARLQSMPPAGRGGNALAAAAGAVSPGSAIQQAARAAASAPHVGGGYGGAGGDYGLGGRAPGKVVSNMEIMSDTMGVDFGPYLSRVLHDVRLNWYNLIPEVARAPLMKQGKVSIEFAILQNGRVAGMKLIGPSGDVSLDRAAWGGITASDPFPPLPQEFRGQYLALRFHFFYNPDKSDLQ